MGGKGFTAQKLHIVKKNAGCSLTSFCKELANRIRVDLVEEDSGAPPKCSATGTYYKIQLAKVREKVCVCVEKTKEDSQKQMQQYLVVVLCTCVLLE